MSSSDDELMQAGDHRDWDAIRSWAEGLVPLLVG